MRPIVAPLRPDDAGPAVADLQAGLLTLLALGTLDIDEGRLVELLRGLREELAATRFADATRRSVAEVQRRRHLEPDGVVDEATAVLLNAALTAAGVLTAVPDAPPAAPAYTVRGTVTGTARLAGGGLRVAVVDRVVGGETLLADTVTGADGRYAVSFDYSGAKPAPDVEVRVLTGDRLLGVSPVVYRAPTKVVCDIALPPDADDALGSEYESLVASLTTEFTGSLGSLEETAARGDVSFLAHKTGWDARAIALASLADRFATRAAGAVGRPAIDPALAYTLFRAGLPADERVYATDADQVETLWRQGIADGVVPATLEASLPDAVDAFRTLQAQHLLSTPAVSGRSSLGDLLSISVPGADATRQEQLASLRLTHRADPDKFWASVARLEPDHVERLRADGRLAYLTRDNAPLVSRLRDVPGGEEISVEGLAARGFYRAADWDRLLDDDVVPADVPGSDPATRRAAYAEALAGQVRLGFPVATLAAMVAAGETPTTHATPDRVQQFLLAHQDIDLGRETVEQHVARTQDVIEPDVQADLVRIQRVRQITPDDASMNALLAAGIDSAYAVTRYDRAEFVAAYTLALGGADTAALVHAKAQQVHNAVLNVALSYLVASNAPGIGVHSPAQIVDPVPHPPDTVGDVLAYASLEKLLGEMDYCDCDHCRSVLSPAAYLVDLLEFCDRDDVRWVAFRNQWKATHGGVPYPHPYDTLAEWADAGSPAEVTATPLEVLLSRRPDLAELPLTCENTNTVVPAIDLVLELLEHFVAHALSLDGFAGHDSGDQPGPDLLAVPQFAIPAAYDALAGRGAPAPVLPPVRPFPFHQPLERLRRLCRRFGDGMTSLPLLLEAVRRDDALEAADADGYGWRDVWREELALSPAEERRLTDRTLTLQELYGFPPGTAEADVVAELSNARALTRRLGLSYDDLVALLGTRFVNPHAGLVPRISRLGISLATVQAFAAGTLTDAELDEALAPGIDPAHYGGDVHAWLRDPAVLAGALSLLVLVDPTGAADPTRFDRIELRYADPGRAAEHVAPFELVRLLRFVRLWQALGWTVEQTDAALAALYPVDQAPVDADMAVNAVRLDAGFRALLPQLGVVHRLQDRLRVRPRDLGLLLACYAPLDAFGPDSAYRRLVGTLADQDPALAPDGVGDVLTADTALLDHEPAVRGVCGLGAADFALVRDALGYDAGTRLTPDTLTAVFRRAWLARTLGLGVAELLGVLGCTGIDPFAPIDPTAASGLALCDLVEALRARKLSPARLVDLLGGAPGAGLGGASAAPDPAALDGLAVRLRVGGAAVDAELAVLDDPDGQVARARMGLVYEAAATDLFFGLLDGLVTTEVGYRQPEAELAPALLAVGAGRLGYDAFRRRLRWTGVLEVATAKALKAVPGAPVGFDAAVDRLRDDNARLVDPLFARFPELRALHDAYVTSPDPLPARRTALLTAFVPTLAVRRKDQLALQTVAASTRTDVALTVAVLTDATVLHAVGTPGAAALEDVTALERGGLSVRLYLRATVGGDPDESRDADGVLDLGPDRPGRLPAHPGDALAGVWTGALEGSTTGLFHLRVDAGTGANVALLLAGVPVTLVADGGGWVTDTPVALTAGTLSALSLTVEHLGDQVSLSWQTLGRGWEVVPARHLYGEDLRVRLSATLARYTKLAALAGTLGLTPAETRWLAQRPEHRTEPDGWVDRLPVSAPPDPAGVAGLTRAVLDVLDLARLKSGWSPDDERLVTALADPMAATDGPSGLLFAVTGWSTDSLPVLLTRFGLVTAQLASVSVLARVATAFDRLTMLGVSAAALVDAAHPDPSAASVADLESALRSRYDHATWREVITPLNDELRTVQRDALVAYVLHQLALDPTSAHIDTADKLFEFFLTDVASEPVVHTSRVRAALSSVQLFVLRCLMNLEPRVAASALNARQWEWMRAYRVWEANRKIFLWPENWISPELRDDASPFFDELLSELLQGDVTDDRAATSLGHYLGKLAGVAKLQPCALHVAPSESGRERDAVVHVVARTAGANRKYHHRSMSAGSWSPWVPIPLDIEDNPVAPVVWRGRLFLFWLRVMIQPLFGPAEPFAPGQDRNLTEVKTSEIKRDPPLTTVKALLCWSEQVGGVWQPVHTSDVERPTTLRAANPAGPLGFDRSAVSLSFADEGTALRIKIGGADGSFVLHTPHSQALRQEEVGAPPYVPGPGRFHVPWSQPLDFSPGTLSMDYNPGTGNGDDNLNRDVLRYRGGGRVVSPQHPLEHPWTAPFLFEDTPHLFYVTTTQTPVLVGEWNWYTDLPSGPVLKQPPLIWQKVDLGAKDVVPQALERQPWRIDPSALVDLVQSPDITRALGTSALLQLGDVTIGPRGRVEREVQA